MIIFPKIIEKEEVTSNFNNFSYFIFVLVLLQHSAVLMYPVVSFPLRLTFLGHRKVSGGSRVGQIGHPT